MPSIEITASGIDEFRKALPADQPVTMLNLLRYRDQAVFPPGSHDEPGTGLAVYQRYIEAVTPLLQDLEASPVFAGRAVAHAVAPEDERWDDILLISWTRADRFLQLADSPEYAKVAYLRTAALADSRLVAFQTGPHCMPDYPQG